MLSVLLGATTFSIERHKGCHQYDTHTNNIWQNDTRTKFSFFSVSLCGVFVAQCHKAERRYAECHFAECHYGSVVQLWFSAIILSVVMLNVVAPYPQILD